MPAWYEAVKDKYTLWTGAAEQAHVIVTTNSANINRRQLTIVQGVPDGNTNNTILDPWVAYARSSNDVPQAIQQLASRVIQAYRLTKALQLSAKKINGTAPDAFFNILWGPQSAILTNTFKAPVAFLDEENLLKQSPSLTIVKTREEGVSRQWVVIAVKSKIPDSSDSNLTIVIEDGNAPPVVEGTVVRVGKTHKGRIDAAVKVAAGRFAQERGDFVGMSSTSPASVVAELTKDLPVEKVVALFNQ